eukprot:jgi/Psemu1/193394/e_gw1.140.71.1
MELNPNDVLIQVCYSDVNPVDLQKMRGRENEAGRPVANPPLHVPGYGGSGRVVKRDKDNGKDNRCWNNGTPVSFLADPTRMGSYATFVVVDANCVARIPPPPPPPLPCASIPVAGLTAYESLVKCYTDTDADADADGRVSSGSLLVVGASGGVGSWTITLARALNPSLKIIATASTQAQHDWCAGLGADVVIQHGDIGSRLEGGREGSVDAIVCLAEPTPELFGTLAEVIKPYGSICLVVAGKSIGSLDLGFCFFKCVDVKTVTVFSSIRTKYKNIVPAKELELIMDMITSGKIKAPLSPDSEYENGVVSESMKSATSKNGVLAALSQPTGRRGNFVMKIDH